MIFIDAMRLSAELQDYAENIWRRFPEVFISLGAPGMDEYYGTAENGHYFHRVIDTTAKRIVQVVMPRRGMSAQRDPFAVEVDDWIFEPQISTFPSRTGNLQNLVNDQIRASAAQEADDWAAWTPPSSVTSSLADRRGLSITPVKTKFARHSDKDGNTTHQVVRAKHLDRGASNDSGVASPQSTASARSLPQDERCHAHAPQAGSGQYMDDHQHDQWAIWGGATGACPDACCCGSASGEYGGGAGGTDDYSRMSFLEEDSSPGTQLQQAALRRKQQMYSQCAAPLGDWYARGSLANYASTISDHYECFEQVESPGALVQRAAAKRRLAQAAHAELQQDLEAERREHAVALTTARAEDRSRWQADAGDLGRTSGRQDTPVHLESPGRQIQRAATQRRRQQH